MIRQGTVVCAFSGLAVVLLASFAPAKFDNARPVSDRDMGAPAAAETSSVAMAEHVVASADATAFSLVAQAWTEREQTQREETADEPIVVSALPGVQLPEMQPLSVPNAIANPTDPVSAGNSEDSFVAILDECAVLEVCVDHYLWELYQRTDKLDTHKVHELRKVKVRKKSKTVTVTRRFTKLVDQDFTWKDPHAATKAGMSMMTYVIGGMDHGFKLRLFHALRAAEKAGLAPGITSGFRDDYRQSIATGTKAAANRSYHGGSLRGGYGNGVAADVVSTKGATRAQRWVSTETLWKWIDANEQFGIGRPYLHKDPPHVAPIDGEEYVSRRGAKTSVAAVLKKPIRDIPRRNGETKGTIARVDAARTADDR